MSVYAKTALNSSSSLSANSLLGSTAMRRLLALVGCSISLGSAGALLLNTADKRQVVAEIPVSPATLNAVLNQNSQRKYALAREMFAAGELDQPPTATPTSQTQPTVIVHEIKRDETLWQLTQMYGVDAASIAASNNISSATELQIGMKLVIPPVDGLIHKVRKGDTLDSIAAFYKVPKAEIIKYSAIPEADFLAIDQPLVIPGNVSHLLLVKEENTKRQLFAERDRLRRRLAQVEGKIVPASNSLDPQQGGKFAKPAKANISVDKYNSTFSYVVRQGDTVETIARRHGVSQQEIVALNKLKNPHWLQIDQQLQIPSKPNRKDQPLAVNPKPAKVSPSLVADAPAGKKVIAATPITMAVANPPAPWNGLMVLVGSTPQNPQHEEQLSALVRSPNTKPELGVAEEPKVAINITRPNSTGLDQLSDQLSIPAKGKPSSITTPVPHRLIAPETEPVSTPPSEKLPTTALAEQESKTPRTAPLAPAVLPQPEREPSPPQSQPLAIAVPLPEIPLSQLADQVEARLSKPVEPTAVALPPDSESRMSSQEVRQLEQEVEQLAIKVREAEERRRQEALRIAAANLQPKPTVDPLPSTRPSGVGPQLPTLTAKAFLPEVQDYGISTGFIWPANGVLTSGYGPRWGRIHQGIDIAGPVGTPIVAAASGRVVFSGWNDGGYGYLVEILHPDGTLTRYAHNSALYVKAGEEVNQGQLIAAMGSTGYSTGPHLHFEIRPNAGAAVDPMIFLAKVRR
jgi:murein DD-endopeptidase MepM/ murein hydrolase activator NlpD